MYIVTEIPDITSCHSAASLDERVFPATDKGRSAAYNYAADLVYENSKYNYQDIDKMLEESGVVHTEDQSLVLVRKVSNTKESVSNDEVFVDVYMGPWTVELDYDSDQHLTVHLNHEDNSPITETESGMLADDFLRFTTEKIEADYREARLDS